MRRKRKRLLLICIVIFVAVLVGPHLYWLLLGTSPTLAAWSLVNIPFFHETLLEMACSGHGSAILEPLSHETDNFSRLRFSSRIGYVLGDLEPEETEDIVADLMERKSVEAVCLASWIKARQGLLTADELKSNRLPLRVLFEVPKVEWGEAQKLAALLLGELEYKDVQGMVKRALDNSSLDEDARSILAEMHALEPGA